MNTSGESEMVSYEEARFYILKLKKDEPAYSSAPSFRKALCNFGLSKTLPPDLNDRKKGFIALSILPEVARSTGKRYNPGGKLGADSEAEAAGSEPVEVMECVELVETFSPDATSTAVTLTLRSYNGIDIPQRPDGYINATKMCQAAGKQWSNFIRLQEAEKYIVALESVLQMCRTDLVLTIQGGDPWQQGTWVHPRLASRLAQWISPEFAVVVDGWVLDILSGNHPMPNEVSHEGAIAKGIAALIESQSKGMSALLESQNILSLNVGHLVNQSDKTIKKLDGLTEDVAHLDGRLKIVEHRSKKGFKKSVQAIYKKVVWKYFGGCCPVYPHIKILQSPEKQIITSRNRTAGEFDHYYAPHNNGLTEGWLVSVQANQDFIYNPALRTQYNHRFETFQDWSRMEYESELGIQLNII